MRIMPLLVYTAAVVFCLLKTYEIETGRGLVPVTSHFQYYAAALCAAVLIPWALFIRRS